MKIHDQISADQKQKLNAVRNSERNRKEKRSRKETEELMGVNMDTYRRVNGRERNK